MLTRISLLAVPASILVATAAILFASQSMAQVNYSANFDLTSTGWTGIFARSPTAACAGQSMRRNLWTGSATGALISPSTGLAFGGNPVTVTYDYKVYDFTGGGPTATPWGNFQVQYGATAAGPWTTIATITDETQVSNTCLNRSHTFTPPAGALFLRWNATHSGGDYYLVFDNVSVIQTVPCGVPAPGNTVGPVDACPGANFTLSLQNTAIGQTVSYQWYSSTVSATGPWTPVGTNMATYVASQTVASWYYCNVTCSVGPNTTASNVLAVPMAGPASLPQGWSTGVVNPDCWSTAQIAGSGLPLYNAASGYAVGAGSVQFNGWNQSVSTENALVSPSLTPTASGSYVLFDVAGDYFGTNADQLFVEQSTDSGATWTTIVSLSNAQVGGVLNTRNIGTNYTTPLAADWVTLAYPLAAGTDRVRFRWVSAFGNNIYLDNFNLTSSAPASHTVVGTGCYASVTSALGEQYASAAAAKAILDGNSLLFVNTGASYVAFWGVGGASAYLAPTSPNTHAVGDESAVTITPTFGSTPTPNGPVTQWTIQANGALTAGGNSNPAGYLSSFAALGTAANLGFYVFHDFNEAAGGQVVSEEIGNMLYITWDAVAGYSQPSDRSTFQYQINMATGHVNLVFVDMPSVDVELNFVGGTLAGVSATPPSSDLTTVTPFVMATDLVPLALTAVGAPIHNGSAVDYTISNLPETSPGSGLYNPMLVFSFTASVPGGYDLDTAPFVFGMPGCSSYLGSFDAFVNFGIVATSSFTFPIAWSVPGTPLQISMQALGSFASSSLANGQNQAGLVVSNALELNIEIF
jgi:hypothetical protein